MDADLFLRAFMPRACAENSKGVNTFYRPLESRSRPKPKGKVKVKEEGWIRAEHLLSLEDSITTRGLPCL